MARNPYESRADDQTPEEALRDNRLGVYGLGCALASAGCHGVLLFQLWRDVATFQAAMLIAMICAPLGLIMSGVALARRPRDVSLAVCAVLLSLLNCLLLPVSFASTQSGPAMFKKMKAGISSPQPVALVDERPE